MASINTDQIPFDSCKMIRNKKSVNMFSFQSSISFMSLMPLLLLLLSLSSSSLTYYSEISFEVLNYSLTYVAGDFVFPHPIYDKWATWHTGQPSHYSETSDRSRYHQLHKNTRLKPGWGPGSCPVKEI